MGEGKGITLRRLDGEQADSLNCHNCNKEKQTFLYTTLRSDNQIKIKTVLPNEENARHFRYKTNDNNCHVSPMQHVQAMSEQW